MKNYTMAELVDILNNATYDYDKGTPSMTDAEWDKLYYKLVEMEKTTHTVLSNSPTQKIFYKPVSSLYPAKHDHLMLSLDKTKELLDVQDFLRGKLGIAMLKLDGLTCSLTYENGKLVKAETRGDGIIGEDITHNARILSSIPQKIDFYDKLVIDGEIICNTKIFNEKWANDYKNPRNFAAGSIRLLDPAECLKRDIEFVAWDCIEGMESCPLLSIKLMRLEELGFLSTVSVVLCGDESLDKLADEVRFLKDNATKLGIPIDGIVFKINDVKEYEKLGHTDHHFRGGLAYKFYDDIYWTLLKDIEWTMGRTGVLTPVAIFEPVDIDGTTVSRANLHNLSVLKEILHTPFVDQNIAVYKANAIIPQIAETNYFLTEDDLNHPEIWHPIPMPDKCPYCSEYLHIQDNEGVQTVHCPNPNCGGKLINRLDHFCSKKGLDIKGLSKATLEKLIDWGWVNEFADIYSLSMHADEWKRQAGFGDKSVTKILSAIESSKKCHLEDFLAALGIPLFGKSSLKKLLEYVVDYEDLKTKAKSDYPFYEIDGFGSEMDRALHWFDFEKYESLAEIFTFIKDEATTPPAQSASIKGLAFCITGKLKTYKNRDELKDIIEANGGKVVSAISSKTHFLINNDINSISAKNVAAKNLNIPIITEEDFKNFLTN